MPNGRGTQMAHWAQVPFLESKWHIKNCQLVNQKHRTHMKTSITWLRCSLDRNRRAQTEVMGLNRAHGHCTHTRYTWQKGSPYFSTGAGLCSQGHGQQHSEQEIELVFLGTGKQFPGERKQEYCMESKTVLDFMNYQNTKMVPSNRSIFHT